MRGLERWIVPAEELENQFGDAGAWTGDVRPRPPGGALDAERFEWSASSTVVTVPCCAAFATDSWPHGHRSRPSAADRDGNPKVVERSRAQPEGATAPSARSSAELCPGSSVLGRGRALGDAASGRRDRPRGRAGPVALDTEVLPW